MPNRKIKKRPGAPYVEPNREMLGDKHLSPEEANAREREDLLKKASAAKIWGQEELEDQERSSGPRLPYQEVIRRLRECNSRLLFVGGSPGSIAIYRPREPWEYDPEETENPEGTEEWGQKPAKQKHRYPDHMYVSGMEKQDLPEYPHVILDTSHLPVREYRGWRSVLIACIKSGAVTYEAAVEQFGDPASDKRSGRWFEQVYKFKRK